MPVIKGQQRVPAAPEAIVLDLGDLARQADCLKQQAEQEVQRIIEQARKEAEKLRKEAGEAARAEGHAAGVEQGRAEGLEQGRKEAFEASKAALEKLQNTWREAIGAWEQQRRELEEQAGRSVIEFTLEMARRLVHRVIEVDSTVVVDQVAQALSLVWRSLRVRVHIHPEDRPALEEAMPSLIAEFDHLERIELVDDPAVDRGGCIIHHGQGRIDARIGEQIDRIVRAIVPDDATVHDQHEQDRQEASAPDRGGTASGDATVGKSEGAGDERT